MAGLLNDLLEFGFLQRAVAAALLVSVASGVIGTYVVVRRISYIAGGIAHCVLGGLGASGSQVKTSAVVPSPVSQTYFRMVPSGS